MPEYGHIFALAMNKKFYRAIRVDAEVRLFVHWVFIISLRLNVNCCSDFRQQTWRCVYD